jgi:transcriptional regulator with PAS, ATPase and Fis domain
LEVLADQASIAIQNAKEYGRVSNELDNLRRRVAVEVPSGHRELVWKSPITGRILEQADKIAQSASPVLILGESGTGKELLGERIHRSSKRADGPLIKVNCAAIPPRSSLSRNCSVM